MTDDLTPAGASAVRLAATVVQLRRERDRARGIAVALEQRLANERERIASAIEKAYTEWNALGGGYPGPHLLHSPAWLVERSYQNAAAIAREADDA